MACLQLIRGIRLLSSIKYRPLLLVGDNVSLVNSNGIIPSTGFPFHAIIPIHKGYRINIIADDSHF